MNHKQQSLTWFSWKKLIILVVLIIFLFIAIYFFSMYKQIKASKIDGFEQSTTLIKNETDIIHIDEMYAFQHDILYHIGYGKTDKEEKKIAFVPKTKNEKVKKENKDKEDKEEDNEEELPQEIITINVSDTLSKQEIESQWREDCEQCILNNSAPAMIDEIPLWELAYIDANDRYVLEYIELEDGEIYEQLKMKRKYKLKG